MVESSTKMTGFPDGVIPANHVPGPQQGHWTYSHYTALPASEKRYEILNGVLYMAPPSPSEGHQKASVRLSYYLFSSIELAGLGHVYTAPFDVELARDTIVQPDVMVVLKENSHKIAASHLIGAPDLAIEILSPGTAKHDRQTKFAVYAQSGVREYWIADPLHLTIEVWRLEEKSYQLLGTFRGEERVQSRVILHFQATAQQLFR